MNDINTFIVSGRLTKDSELKKFESGSCKLDFSIATNSEEVGKDGKQEKTYYLDFTIWGKWAEAMESRLKKGLNVTIQGKLAKDSYEKDGKKIYQLKLIPTLINVTPGAPKTNNETPFLENQKNSFPEDIPF